MALYDVVQCPQCQGMQVALNVASTKVTSCRLPSCGKRFPAGKWRTFGSHKAPDEARLQLQRMAEGESPGEGQLVEPMTPKPPNQVARLGALLRRLGATDSTWTREELEDMFKRERLGSALESWIKSHEIYKLSGSNRFTVSPGAYSRLNWPQRKTV